jgi:Domain of unknown function (DUF4129)
VRRTASTAPVVTGMTGATWLTVGPLVGRSQGNQLARRELARAIYHPSLLSRLAARFGNWLESLALHGPSGGLNWLAVTLLGIAVLALLGVAGYIAGSARVGRRYRAAVIEGKLMSAAEHRSAADAFAAAGDYPSAIIERVRAIAVDLESRQILPPRPGRTAAELGAEAAAAIPAEATALSNATRLFDDVRYGGRPGSQAGYQQIRDLDLRIRAAAIQVSGAR